MLDQAIDGQGALVLVSGTAGIGKTTLVNDLMQAARERGVLTLSGGCYALTSSPPYGLWAEAIRGYKPDDKMPGVPSWIDGLGPGMNVDSQHALHEELRCFLAEIASIQPLVVVLEDLHWSDPASLDALRYVARQHHIPPVLIVGTFRSDEIAPNHPLYDVLPLLVRETAATRIELQAFDAEDVQSLVRTRYRLEPEDEIRLVDDLLERTAGNPFFLTEVLRVLESEQAIEETESGWRLGDLEAVSVPPLVRQVIESWLSRLENEDRHLLEVASVIGQDVRPDVWEAVADVDAGRIAVALDRAIDSGLMVQNPGLRQVTFTHALVRETLYQRLPMAQRRTLHRDVAGVLSEQPDISPDTVASHFAQAGDPRAVDWLVRSGERALSLYAARESVAAFSRAHDLAVRFSQNLPIEVYRKRASAYMMLGKFDLARRDFDLVRDRACASGERMLEWQTLIDLTLLWAERDYDRSGSYCRAALDLAREIGDRPIIARSLNRIANWYVNVDDPERALPLHREALAIFEDDGDERGIAATLDFIGMASYLNRDHATSTEHYERAASLFRDLGDRQQLSICLSMLALNGGDLDSVATPVYREAVFWLRCGEEALEIAREIGWPAGEAFALITLSMAVAARGDLERALDCAREGLEIAERIDHREWTVMARYSLGRTLMELHQTERAESELELALVGARQAGWRLGAILSSATLAALYAWMGEADRGAAVLGTLSEPAESNRSMAAYQRFHAEAQVRLTAGDVDSAMKLVDKLVRPEPASEPASGSGASPLILKLQGDVLAGARRFEDAELAYQGAAECARLYGFLPLLWRISAAMGNLYRDHDHIQKSEAAHQSARSTIDELAARIEDETLRESFRSRSEAQLETTTEASPPGVEELTPREMEVLHHLVEGKTDREIADDLYISPRTVMRHVASILRKLDMPSRTAAATFAVREDLV